MTGLNGDGLRRHIAATIAAFLLAGAAFALGRSDSLDRALSRLRRASSGDVVERMQAVLRAGAEVEADLVRRLADPATRVEALAEVAAVDEDEADRIRAGLPAGPAPAELVRELIAPFVQRTWTKRVETHLAASLRRSASEYEKTLRPVLALAPKLRTKKRAERVALAEAWQALVPDALERIRDVEAYPEGNPRRAGQKTVEEAVERVRAAHAALLEPAAVDLAALEDGDPARLAEALAEAAAWRAARDACERLIADRGAAAPKPLRVDLGEPERMRLAVAFVLAASGRPSEARAELREADAYDRSLLRLALHDRAAARNAALDTGEVAAHDPVEAAIVARINDYRTLLDLAPLEVHPALIDASRRHSQEMSARGELTHHSPSPDLRTPTDRALRAGYARSAVAECIYEGTAKVDEEEVFLAWYRSATHHRMMVSERYGEVGLGRSGRFFTAKLGGGRDRPAASSRQR
ncbi:MAG: CAP domain-containing protein [Planctomycetota bacterium]